MLNKSKHAINVLFYMGIILIFVNLFFHLFNLTNLISPFNFSSIMTIFTSISLFGIYLSFVTDNKRLQYSYWSASIISQIVSLLLLKFADTPSWIYLISSSVTTSISIFLIVLFSFMSKFNFSQRIKLYYGPILFLINIGFLYCFISAELHFLGVIPERVGVGLSPYTLISFFFISTMMTLQNTKLIILKYFRIKYRPLLILFILLIYSLLSFLLLYCPKEDITLTAICLHIIFVTLISYLLISPFLNEEEKYLTVCAWSKKIKTSDGDWITQDEMLNLLGLEITHGISPEEKKKLFTP